MTSAEVPHSGMVARLAELDELSLTWRPAFEAVPRHWFIPDRVWRHQPGDDADLIPVERAGDDALWWSMACANASVVTQVDDGHPGPDGRGREASSSASMPAVVATMLDALGAEPGMRVLEIGTGTGWNAALLAHRLGAGAVCSVEVDPAVADHARQRLALHGFGAVEVITGDGADGWAPRAPYDRVIATVAAHQVPHAWVAQTRPGGVVLVPWGTSYYPGGLLRFKVTEGVVGHGRIVGAASFMPLRSQRRPRDSIARSRQAHPHAEISVTDLHPWYVRGEADAATAIGLSLPGVRCFFAGGVLYLLDPESLSWATVDVGDQAPYEVRQAGPRRLHDEVVTAYQDWRDTGQPAAGDWLITVDQTGQRVELNRPGHLDSKASEDTVAAMRGSLHGKVIS